MNASIQRLTQLWSRAEIRLALAGVAGLLAVYLGFMGVSVAAADRFIKHAGYYVMLASFGLFLHALWRWWRWRPAFEGEPMTRRRVPDRPGGAEAPRDRVRTSMVRSLHER